MVKKRIDNVCFLREETGGVSGLVLQLVIIGSLAFDVRGLRNINCKVFGRENRH
jgi:hypothetical protein